MTDFEKEVSARLDAMEQKLNRIAGFCDMVIGGLTTAASSPGMQGMMVRNMMPPEMMAALSQNGR